MTCGSNKPPSGHEASEVVRLAKTEVASIEDVDTWVTRIHHYRWYLAGAMGVLVAVMSLAWLNRQDFSEWMGNTWEFSKLLVPLLFGGVFVVGFLGALIPEKQVAALVGDNSLLSNLIASVVGCLFYFATLTEVPILEALMRNGMHNGPALALLLAGPALSLPSILVIRSVVGNAKTAVFVDSGRRHGDRRRHGIWRVLPVGDHHLTSPRPPPSLPSIPRRFTR